MKKFVLQKDEHRQKRTDYSLEYENLLNRQQMDAVFFDDGAALVVAGAGTGKTRTLTYRVARLVESGIPPEQILLLTFTRRAAREMLNRASQVLDERCKRVQGGTFHFYCSQLLHRYAEKLGFKNTFTIIDAADAQDVLQLLRTDYQYHQLDKRFPTKKTLYSMFSTAVNKQQSIHEVVDEQYSQFMVHIDRLEHLYGEYQRYKRQHHVMDFDDLLLYTIELLEEHPQIRAAVTSKLRYVMVDEYQDTNALQAKLTQLFSSHYGNVMVVGDDAQSIYSFRGADHANIMDFPDQFEEVKIIKLEENYRSTKRILDLTNRLLDQAKFKYNKRLYTQNEAGDLPALVKAPDQQDQSRFLSQMILNLREQGYELNECAVLFRNGRDSYDLEVELNRKNIPFVKYGGQKFSEAAHIKDVLAHLRVLVNPLDTIAWNRVLMLLDGIGPKTAQDLYDWIRNAEDPYQLSQSDRASERYLKQLDALSTVLQRIKTETPTVPDSVEIIVEYYTEFCKKRYDDHPKRLKDLEAFVGISENYRTLKQMLEELALDPINRTALETEGGEQDEDPLVLSTIHSAKGLEWSNVFIIQCLDGVIPSGFSVDDESQLDEELRLLYVACTRAQEHLFLTYPVTHQTVYGDYLTNPSRFITEIEEEILEPWLLVEEPSESSALEDTADSDSPAQLTD
ncbi:MAG: ATP-dependent helicase [Bacteroidota bacterium]